MTKPVSRLRKDLGLRLGFPIGNADDARPDVDGNVRPIRVGLRRGALLSALLLTVVALVAAALLMQLQGSVEDIQTRGTQASRELGEAGKALDAIRTEALTQVAGRPDAAAIGATETKMRELAKRVADVLGTGDGPLSVPSTDFSKFSGDTATSLARLLRARGEGRMNATAAAAAVSALLADADEHLQNLAASVTEATNVEIAGRGAGLRRQLVVLLVIALLMVYVIMAVIYRAGRRIVGRIEVLADDVARFAEGDMDARAEVGSNDEVGHTAVNFNHLAERLQTMIQDEREQAGDLQRAISAIDDFAQRVASGDLRARVDLSAAGNLSVLAHNLNQMVDGLARISHAVQTGSTDISSSARQIFAVVSEHNAATAEQAASIAQTTVTVDEVRVNAQQAAARALELAERAREAQGVSTEGTQVVSSLLVGMDEIQRGVEAIAEEIRSLEAQRMAIGQINESVTDLAEQSNMLALNATIEAARAGDQGRGFAVVAAQVRTLAEQSKQATQHVQALLGEIDVATGKAVRAAQSGVQVVREGRDRAGHAGTIFDRISAAVFQTASIAEQIAAGAREQAIGMDQIGAAMHDVSRTTDELSKGADQTQAAAGLLTDVAGRLTTTTGRYQTDHA